MGTAQRAPVPDRRRELHRVDDVRCRRARLLGVRVERPRGDGVDVRDAARHQNAPTRQRRDQRRASSEKRERCGENVRVGHVRRDERRRVSRRGRAARRPKDQKGRRGRVLQRGVSDVLRVAALGNERDADAARRGEFILADERGDNREWVFVGGVWVCVERLVFVQSKRVWRGGRRRATGVFSNL